MAGVTPQQIYQALLAAGASTIQAIGIMANMIAESGLNPEAVGDNGTSFGLVQQHGAQYASLVTGNPQADMTAQVNVIAANGGFGAASGSSAAQAAGNFAAGYERCVGCQPGGGQYSARVANAATVAGWVASGSWPTSAGSATASASSGPGSGVADATCALSVGGQHLGLVFGHGPSLPSACLVRKTEVRAFAGFMVLSAGAGVFLVGTILLAAFAFRASGAARAVVQVASVVPGAAPAARAARGAGAAARVRARG